MRRPPAKTAEMSKGGYTETIDYTFWGCGATWKSAGEPEHAGSNPATSTAPEFPAGWGVKSRANYQTGGPVSHRGQHTARNTAGVPGARQPRRGRAMRTIFGVSEYMDETRRLRKENTSESL